MAERPSELNDNTGTEEKDEKMIAVMSDASDASDNSYLNDTSDEETFSTAETDEEVPVEAEQIRAKIEDTRQQMGETIDAIQERLSFSNISEQVKTEVSDKITDVWETTKYSAIRKVEDIMRSVNQGIGEIADTQVGHVARNNPVAITLIGLGVGMLLMNLYRKDSSTNYSRRSLSSGSSNYGRTGNRAGYTGGSAYDTVSDTASDAYGAVTDAASGAYDQVTGAANTAYKGVGNVAGRAYEQVGSLGSSVKDVAGKAYDQYDHYIEENPLAVGAVAMALGAAVGLSIPATTYESKLMGESRDKLMHQAGSQVGDLIRNAGEVAQDKIDKIKTVAEQTVNKATDEAKNQDLI